MDRIGIFLQAGGEGFLTEPGSLSAFGILALIVGAFYYGKLVTGSAADRRVDELKTEFEKRYTIVFDQMEAWKAQAQRAQSTNSDAIAVTKLVVEK